MAELELPKKALTLYQPYAWLVAHGYKPIENRPPGFSQRTFRGAFWIHAGLLKSEPVWAEARAHTTTWLGADFYLPSLDELEYGVIIGRASITGVIDPRRSTSEQQLLHPHGDKPVPWHFPAQYGLIVDGAKPLKRGIVARGYQGFWPVGEDTLKAIETVL